MGWVRAFSRHYDEAVANVEKAIKLELNNAELHAALGQIMNFCGEPQRGLELAKKAQSLDALSPPLWDFFKGISNLLLWQFNQALTDFCRVTDRVPMFVPVYAYLAWTYVELDRLNEARCAIKTLREIAPRYVLGSGTSRNPYRIEEIRNRFHAALRKAGLPES